MIFVAEEQGPLNIQFPSYVTRGETEPEISEAEKRGVV